MISKAALGQAGEQAARAFLEARGWAFREARWRCAAGEVDLVMQDGPALVFVEVRTRLGAEPGAALESITPRKAARMVAVALEYLAAHDLDEDTPWRIDAAAVTATRNPSDPLLSSSETAALRFHVEVIEDAAGW